MQRRAQHFCVLGACSASADTRNQNSVKSRSVMTSARKQLPIALSPYCQQQVLWLPPTVQAINISSTSSTRLNN
jgi:hypothetical protein